jgi:hypothetical protein
MNLPAGVTEAQWQQALVNAGLWKPGQRCERSSNPLTYNVERHTLCKICGFDFTENRSTTVYKPHDIPMPVVTDELLWQMLVNLVEQCDMSVELFSDGCIELDGVGGFRGLLAAAVIRATASLEVK